MAITDLFSKRSKKSPDVFRYDDIPMNVRVQTVQIIQEQIPVPDDHYHSTHKARVDVYRFIVTTLRREKGVFQLPPMRDPHELDNYWAKELFGYILNSAVIDMLDATEIAFRVIERITGKPDYFGNQDAEKQTVAAIEELNYRFMQAGVGYRYSDGAIIKADSELLHAEVVVPALEALRLPGYAGAQAEFLKAHEHYRHRRNAEALNECYKAFESLMKSICDKHGWTYDKTKAASHLVDVCLKNHLVPTYYQTHMTGLRQVLESAIPTPRNKTGAHGAGSVPITISDEIASYVIHLTASTLLYLATAEKKLK